MEKGKTTDNDCEYSDDEYIKDLLEIYKRNRELHEKTALEFLTQEEDLIQFKNQTSLP